MRDSNDHETENPKEILSELKLFYEDLYARKSAKTDQECLSYLEKVNTPKLSEEERDICDGQLSIQECWNALNSMQNGKSPGNDGLSKEFYVCFFAELGDLLVNTQNYSFKCGELTTSQKQAIITLIEKKGRDKRLIKNWRPISLLNVDVKIAPKAMALRIKPVIHKLVHCDQTPYV